MTFLLNVIEYVTKFVDISSYRETYKQEKVAEHLTNANYTSISKNSDYT